MLLLCGDIGGTKTVLRLVEVDNSDRSFTTIKEARFVSANYPDLVPIVKEFVQENALPQAELASFAIAGPVADGSCNLTNLSWQLSTSRLEEQLQIKKIFLLNDFAANSYGVLGLKEDELLTLQTGNKRENSPIAVIGAGTGLGQGFLIPNERKYQVFSSEGGHADFAPRNQLEIDLLCYLKQKLNLNRISVERIVSGQGIISIYQFLRDTNFASEDENISQKITTWENNKDTDIDPGATIAMGAQQQDTICLKTMSVFAEAYGVETGNLALKLLPYGGIYIAGGIAAKNIELMKKGEFLAGFLDKGRMSKLLKDIPVNIVLNPQVGLIGAILYALEM